MAIEITVVDSICNSFQVDHEQIKTWLTTVIQREGKVVGKIDFILCDDHYLHGINSSYLQHDTYTDIITFPYDYSPIEAEIYISCDRILENAKTFAQADNDRELLRVMVHGILHMCGYNDQSPEEKSHMRTLENRYLELWYQHS